MLPSDKLLLKPPSPDQLDRMLRVSSPLGWLATWVLAAVIMAALVWSVIDTVPVKVTGQGILLPSGGVSDVIAPAGGRVVGLLARAGDAVYKGQIIAHLLQPDLDSQLSVKTRELETLAAEKRDRHALQAREADVSDRLMSKQAVALHDRIAVLEARHRSLVEQRNNVQALIKQGYSTLDKLIATTAEATNAEKELADARSSLVQLEAQNEDQRARAQRESLEIDARIDAAEREKSRLEADRAERTLIRSPVDGVVVEEVVAPGDIPGAGSPILRIVPGAPGQSQKEMLALVFVPPNDGKKVRVGMPVQVIPSVVKVERDGFIIGTVSSVSDLPASHESMVSLLGNAKLAEQLSSSGSPYLVQISLARDSTTPSGFHWSTGRGPNRSIEVGTMVRTMLVVDQIRIISLVIPQIETILRPLGL